MEASKLYIKTYGCQMNVYDSDRMADLLSPLGYTLAQDEHDADLVIFNTCHIREKAAEKLYSDLGRIRPLKQESTQSRKRPMMIVVAGCTAQAEGQEVMRRAPYVDMVVGPQSYQELPKMIAQAQRDRDRQAQELRGKQSGVGILNVEFKEIEKFDALPEARHGARASAFLTIQEGCDKFCHFCVVPYTRGAEYSRPVQDVLTEAKQLVAQGATEITLLGQNVNGYHGESPRNAAQEWGLGRLIMALAEIDGLRSIRYTTSHPRDVDEALIEAHAKVTTLAPFLHLPVQSGSDRMLKAMNRKHSAAEYLNIIEKFRRARPDMAFSSDFIVGYPGETDRDHADTLELVRQVEYASCFSFKYSPRPGTPAWAAHDQVADAIKQERLQELQSLLKHQQISFNAACVGYEMPILLEKKGRNPGQVIGRSPYMQSVYLNAPEELIGSWLLAKITGYGNNSLAGEDVTPRQHAVAS